MPRQRERKSKLLRLIAKDNEPLNISTFRENIVELFDDILQEQDLSGDLKSKLAKLRARVVIELRDV